MQYVNYTNDQGIVTVKLTRGKVNALNETVVDEITGCLKELADDAGVRAVILTGTGKFFTFGFDIPEFLNYPKESFIRYLTKFTDLYAYLFMFPKPVIAALNGHTIAGGCMLAIACDYRIMVSGKAKIALNEINFGSSLFAGSVDILKLLLGQREAEKAAYTGAMYSAEEAHRIGLIDQISSEAELEAEAKKIARQYAEKDGAAFRSIKKLFRGHTAELILKRERDSILEFVGIWYSENTWRSLQEKKIY
ncbi:MAG TPA: enoyl-CoA hydratase/isomerase family protein [Syntrophales bacterium]|nr:enoyl-CoA hydratase/isomerase family protein [Syntrophales bacterium]